MDDVDAGTIEERFAALEAEVRELRSRLAASTSASPPAPVPTGYDRRALLRRGGLAAAAGLVGAAALPALAGTAAAATGQPVTIGQVNTADSGSSTTLTASNPSPGGAAPSGSTKPTLVLTNTGRSQPGASSTLPVTSPEPSLRLTMSTGPGDATSGPNLFSVESGDLVNSGGFLYYGHFDQKQLQAIANDPAVGFGLSGLVLTNAVTSAFQVITPTRVLDTRVRGMGGDAPASNFDAKGRLVAGASTSVDVSAAVAGGTIVDAVVGNLTIVAPVGSGYASVYPTGSPPVPLTSNINYQSGQNIANGFTVGTNGVSIEISTYKTCHLVVDIFALYLVNPVEYLLGVATGPSPARTRLAHRQAQVARAARARPAR